MLLASNRSHADLFSLLKTVCNFNQVIISQMKCLKSTGVLTSNLFVQCCLFILIQINIFNMLYNDMLQFFSELV